MIPVNQFILGSSDPLLYPSENNGTTQNQQVVTQGIWDAIDALQSMVQAEVLNLVKGKIEASEDGKHLLKVWEYFHMNN